MFFLQIVVNLIIFGGVCATDTSNDSHVRLLKHLLDRPDYERLARPVRNVSHNVNVRTRLTLYQLIDVEEPLESVSLYMWMVQKWDTELFNWNPKDYGNHSWIVIPAAKDFIWTPDIVLYNGLLINAENSERQINIELMTNRKNPMKGGVVRYAFPAIYQFRCKVDMTYFPFDTQNCTMVFGSWIHNAKYLTMYHYQDTVNMESYIPNGEWELLSFQYESRLAVMKEGESPYSVMYFHLCIKRRPLFIMIHLVVPVIFVTVVSMVGFFTPTSSELETSEKAQLGITALLAMSVSLMIVSEKMPTTSFIPLLAWYMLAVIMLMCIATISGTVVIIVHRWNYLKVEMSQKQTRVIKLIAKLLCMRLPIVEPDQKDVSQNAKMESESAMILANIPTKSSSVEFLEDFNQIDMNGNGDKKSPSTQLVGDSNGTTMSWDVGASVLERLFLIGYCLVVILLNVVVFGVSFYASL